MGTPDFAVASLKILHENQYPVLAVITATDKWGGRNNKTQLQSAVKKYALEHGLPVLQPKNLKDPEFVQELKALNADLQIVVAFRMLPKIVWDMPKLGTINLHASLLPAYRGAAPINWAIIRGEKVTGVTTFFIRENIDTGDILLQEEVPIIETDTAGSLHDKLMETGAFLILKTVEGISEKNITPIPQSEAQVSLAPKIFHDTCAIDFAQNSQEVYNFIRGLSPYPGAWALFLGKEMKIFDCYKEQQSHLFEPGTFASDNKTYLKVAVRDGWLFIKSLQMQGKKKMEVAPFLNGIRFNLKDFLGEKIISE